MRQLKITKQITNRENISLDKYLQEISKMPMISVETEVELAVRIKQGDDLALQKLAQANLRFVVSVAKQYQNKGLALNDLISEGNIGLVKAAMRFDETRGFKFISYAVWWIRQSILQALAEQSRVVRLPLNKVGTLSKMTRVFADLEQKFQREPTSEEISQAMDVSLQEVESTVRSMGKHVSVDAPLANNLEGSLLDLMADNKAESPDAGLEMDSMKIAVKRALSALSEREATIIVSYYGLNGGPSMSLEDIAEHLNLTRERIRQIKEKATRRLRKVAQSTLLSYLK